MTSLRVICGLGPPQSKILATPMSAMLVVMTVRTVLKVPFEKAAPPCPSVVAAPL